MVTSQCDLNRCKSAPARPQFWRALETLGSNVLLSQLKLPGIGDNPVKWMSDIHFICSNISRVVGRLERGVPAILIVLLDVISNEIHYQYRRLEEQDSVSLDLIVPSPI